MNALEEIQEFIPKLKAAKITFTKGSYYSEEHICFNLYSDHTEEELQEFLKSMAFNYHNGYGGQELFGTLWLKDNTWVERGEYAGSEWWDHRVIPELPTRN